MICERCQWCDRSGDPISTGWRCMAGGVLVNGEPMETIGWLRVGPEERYGGCVIRGGASAVVSGYKGWEPAGQERLF